MIDAKPGYPSVKRSLGADGLDVTSDRESDAVA